jgi:hypothetical protein
MTTLALPVMPRSSALWNAVVRTVTSLPAGIREGCEIAAHYDALAYKTDSDLQALGIKREDIPAIVMFGHHR